MDVELSWLATDHWSLGLVATYLFKAEIDEDVSVFDDRSPEDVVLEIPAGTQLPLSSDLNVAAYTEFQLAGQLDGRRRCIPAPAIQLYRRVLEPPGRRATAIRTAPVTVGARRRRLTACGICAPDSAAPTGSSPRTSTISPTNARWLFHDTNADLFWGRDSLSHLAAADLRREPAAVFPVGANIVRDCCGGFPNEAQAMKMLRFMP